ncbi:MAG TPA: DUF1116 domain-containing protein [Actinomycetes bacterium]|nr:DUF1116 domain-containing protein [Actinomycetes bacterium]
MSGPAPVPASGSAPAGGSASAGAPAPPVASLPAEVNVVNVGLPLFADAIRDQDGAVVDVEWRIPAGGRPELVAALTRLSGRWHDRVHAANEEVLRRLNAATPMLTGLARCDEAVPGVGSRTVLHCGPALDWAAAGDPLRRSIAATVVAEGWADGVTDVPGLVETGAVQLASANAHDTVLPMATAIGPSAPVLVVDDEAAGTRAFSAINQGSGQAPWMGVDTPEAVARLITIRDVVAPVLRAALVSAGPIDVFGLVAQGLQMGDEVHMRSQATANLLWRTLLPHLVAVDAPNLVEAVRVLSANHLFFLNVAMAAAKATLMAAYDVPDSSVVVGMSRNGTSFGIRLAGTGEQEFVAVAPPVGSALYHSGFGEQDAAPDIGDSALLELIGLGGAAAAASPAVAAFLGGSVQDAIATSAEMELICAGRSSRFTLPLLEHRGSPLGVDACAVVETETTPAINTGILHVSDGLGQVGAGIARAPLDCFQTAVLALDARLTAGG